MDEVRKVFRIFDDDDTGLITAKNLENCAEELNLRLTKDQIEMMLSMADRDKKSSVNYEDFIYLMKEIKILHDDCKDSPCCDTD